MHMDGRLGPLQLATTPDLGIHWPLATGPTPNPANTYIISSEGPTFIGASFCKGAIFPQYVTRGNRGEEARNFETNAVNIQGNSWCNVNRLQAPLNQDLGNMDTNLGRYFR